MFTRISRSGGREYLQLVESYRNEHGKPRHRVIANLGRIDHLQAESLRPLINGLQRAAGLPESKEPAAARVEFESSKAFGDLFALHSLWSELGLASSLQRALRSSRRQFDAEALVRAMVFNRLCAPTSKLGLLAWLDTVAMPQMPKKVTHDQLLRAMDALMEHLDAVEKAVACLLRPLLDDELAVVFYDLTTIRISGEAEVEDDVRAYGMSKELRGVGRQFVLGVVQTAEGLPIAHEVHAGNIGETRTLIPMIERTCQRYALKRVVLVADRGLLSLDNLEAIEALRAADGQPLEYILAVPGRRYSEFSHLLGEPLLDSAVREGVVETTWQERRVVMAHDEERAQRQQQQRRCDIAALEAEGQRMADRLDQADAGRPGRGRRSSDRRAYVRFHELTKAAGLSRIVKADLQADRFSFSIDEAALAAAQKIDGKLLLVTNTALAPKAVVARYKALADIERGFRVLKSDIEIAPVHHRLPERIRAHALICFLALVLYRIIRMRLRAGQHALSPQKALALLRQIQQHQAAVNSQKVAGTSRMTSEQRDLFAALNIAEPTTGTAV